MRSALSFNSMILNCGMLEFTCLDNKLFWRGNCSYGMVRCWLDHALGNEEWHNLFSYSLVKYLQMDSSTDSGIIQTCMYRTNCIFRFDKRWIDKEGLTDDT